MDIETIATKEHTDNPYLRQLAKVRVVLDSIN
jgi:hypothetical protein